MDKLFLTILNMSLTGAFVIAAICLARLPLKKAPKIISYCLWAVAGFRLAFPFSIESVISLIPFKAQTIPTDIATQSVPRIDSGIPYVNNAVSSVLPVATPSASANPLQFWITIGAYVWLLGAAVMLIYGVVSYLLLKRKMRGAIQIDGNIYEAENIKSPFVLGIFAPNIYLPVDLSKQERSYVILHEQTHIRRRDHLVKFAAYFILCLHWFNPLAWVAFLLMGADMEMSCDERVLKEIGGETKKDYSLSLLSLATERRTIGGSPLAFGEGGIKERVKNVLNFKKTSRMMIVTAVAVVAVLSVGFAVNKMTPLEPPGITVQADHKNIEWVVGKNKWNGSAIDRLDNFQQLMSEITVDELAYVQNGEQITIQIDGTVPDSITLTEYILNDNGEQKYNIEGMSYDVSFGILNRTSVLTLTPNDATSLSSNSADYAPGNTIKGYRLVCAWGENECEYAFIVRGDAAIPMEPLGDTVTIVVWKDNNGQTLYSLFYGEVTYAQSGSSTDRTFSDIDGLNGALAEYPQDTIGMVYVKHTADFTKEETMEITDQFVIPSDNYSMTTGVYAFSGISDLEAAVSDVILHNENGYLPGVLATQAHTTLATVEQDDTVTVYLMVLFHAYEYSDGGFSEIGGSHGPVAITFDKESDGGYIMTEYWTPQDGEYYPSSIKEKFPPDIYEDAIYTQKYVYAHVMSCHEQAIKYWDIDTDSKIASLIETICSSPAEASNPGAYIEAHGIEFRELIYFGRYTLDYCFSLFEQGSQTGLEGHIMAAACREIMTVFGETVTEGNFDTGQDWYHAQSVSE